MVFSQQVRDRFELLSFSDNFDTPSDRWSTEANSDNLFVIQDGEYILHRKNNTSPFLVIAGLTEDVTNCRFVASLKIEKNIGTEPHAGLLFMMQPQGSGGFLIELNRKKDYRIRQINAGVYKYLTGNSKNGGWVKCEPANEAGLNNIIEIITADGFYDLYINDRYLVSFYEPSYKSGKIGLVIGPDTRARLDYVYIFTKGTPPVDNDQQPSANSNAHTDPGEEVIRLAESIIQLKTQINTLKQDNEDLKKAVSSLRSGDKERSAEIKSMEMEIKSMQDQIANKDAEIAKLIAERDALAKFKEMAGGNENSDVVITLSKALKAEKEKTMRLEEELRKLKMGEK
jgi:cell division protein FtsB